jgi:hypothetical protein
MAETRLLYLKRFIYVHPTHAQKDNVQGCLALIARDSHAQREVLVAWCPESQLNDASFLEDSEEQCVQWPDKNSPYAFAVPLSQICSL